MIMNQFPLRNSRKDKLQHAQSLLDQAARAFTQNSSGEALLFFQEAYLIRAAVLGGDHPQTGEVAERLGQMLQETGRLAEARDFFAQTLEGYSAPADPQYLHLAQLVERLGNQLFGQDDFSSARDWYKLAQFAYEKALGPKDRQVLFILQKQVGL